MKFLSAISLVISSAALVHSFQHEFTVQRPVPIELFVMSKCPDKVYCESVIAQVLEEVRVPVTLSIDYIGTTDKYDPLRTTCMHGPSECLGNKQELCFKRLNPDIKSWFPFDLCLNRNYDKIGTSDSLFRACVNEQGKNANAVHSCATSQFGARLLSESVQHTKSLGIRKSCTIFINHKLRCVRDGEWKDCEGGYKVSDFVQTIEDSYYQNEV
ncbi:hypothetical protein J3Q64DRAFT_1735977 [Phycomyces blakesleeanus]|uniref:Uncharacterized protein n=2 Tax=Phycomyces blakesleeanus TaxID=4837 RepID=A0A163CZV9_PHYB8|nr:hypothetical protein PHYBLDRAFT_160360 [Phycomyces blakesleeanus NRRL 1555(-)]OAD67700.1 hypothetical protein PHYBLDRAFT_160360 [Phycomyces blakesleeanus NRRL 1555(-)]|eukprot:XP_018285740.1 hypothetical protein PHYBLDRAFT_160360 [Phycomyces blakesleeanus NRRL 1555(-)]